MENDSWGKPYKVVLGKLRGAPAMAAMELREIRGITSALFSYCSPPEVIYDLLQGPLAMPKFPVVEVMVVIRQLMSEHIAPGSNSILSRVLGRWARYKTADAQLSLHHVHIPGC